MVLLFPLLGIGMYLHYLHASIHGVPPGYTGSPYDGVTCATMGCHTGTVQHVTGLIQTDVPPLGYNPADTYNITLSISRPNTSIFGFQVTAGDDFFPQGRFLITDNTEMQYALSEEYVTHRPAGTSGNNERTWQMQWVAPDYPIISPIAIYVSMVAGTFLVDEESFMSYLPLQLNQSMPGPVAGSEQPEVYPNPFTHRIVVRWPDANDPVLSMVLYNAAGNRVYATETLTRQGNEYIVDTGLLSSGVYYLQVTSTKRSFRQKLLNVNL